MNKITKVWVLIYSHRFGDDVSVYDSLKAAKRAEKNIRSDSDFREDDEYLNIEEQELQS